MSRVGAMAGRCSGWPAPRIVAARCRDRSGDPEPGRDEEPGAGQEARQGRAKRGRDGGELRQQQPAGGPYEIALDPAAPATDRMPAQAAAGRRTGVRLVCARADEVAGSGVVDDRTGRRSGMAIEQAGTSRRSIRAGSGRPPSARGAARRQADEETAEEDGSQEASTVAGHALRCRRPASERCPAHRKPAVSTTNCSPASAQLRGR